MQENRLNYNREYLLYFDMARTIAHALSLASDLRDQLILDGTFCYYICLLSPFGYVYVSSYLHLAVTPSHRRVSACEGADVLCAAASDRSPRGGPRLLAHPHHPHRHPQVRFTALICFHSLYHTSLYLSIRPLLPVVISMSLKGHWNCVCGKSP